jgi:ribosome-associated protein
MAHGRSDADEEDWEGPSGPSKSQLKREQHAIQALAARLTALPRGQLEALKLSPATWEALDETARIKDIRALKRHYKRISKLLQREDMHAIQALMNEAEARARAAIAGHHRLEHWRERLIGEGDDALTEFLDEHPGADRQQLRALVRAARRDTERGRPEAPRKLFRFLRDTVEATAAQEEEMADDASPDDEDAVPTSPHEPTNR